MEIPACNDSGEFTGTISAVAIEDERQDDKKDESKQMRQHLKLYLPMLGFVLALSSTVAAGEDPTFTTIDFPGASFTSANGINAQGDVVGAYMSAGVMHGYLLSDGSFTTIDFPGASSTVPRGINPRGDIVGIYG